jgi:hypothetical protein
VEDLEAPLVKKNIKEGERSIDFKWTRDRDVSWVLEFKFYLVWF